MPSEADNPLGEFLRARRALADPARLGLPALGRRRVPGLRREELAIFAGMSPHYYARLEQGRDRNPSPQVLEAIARVLDLDAESLDLLRDLARPGRTRPSQRPYVPEQVRPPVISLMRQWTGQAVIVIGRYRDVLAANELATALNPGFRPGVNLIHNIFLNPAARSIYLDWAEVAESGVAALRASAGTHLDDPRMSALIDELSRRSDDFRGMWARHDVREKPGGWKRFLNAQVGPIRLRLEAFNIAHAGGQIMYAFFADPGTEDARAMARLADLAHASGLVPVEVESAAG